MQTTSSAALPADVRSALEHLARLRPEAPAEALQGAAAGLALLARVRRVVPPGDPWLREFEAGVEHVLAVLLDLRLPAVEVGEA